MVSDWKNLPYYCAYCGKSTFKSQYEVVEHQETCKAKLKGSKK